MDADMKVGKVDFAIITILPEEFDAIYNRFEPEPYIASSGHTYGISRVQTKSGQTCKVAVARTPRPGNDASQQLATQIIHDLDPQILLVVGIGGGVPDNDFTLGDVIVSSHIHNFDLNAIKGNQTTYDVGGGPVHPIVSNIVAGLGFYRKQMADWNSEAAIGMARPELLLPTLLLPNGYIQSLLDKGIDQAWREKVEEVLLWHFDEQQRGRRAPKFLTGTIASSNSLVRSDAVLAQWLETARSIRAVEMEAAGVYLAAQLMRQQYPVMAIRGISDIVGFKRNDDWKQYACHTAAAFAHAFIAADIIEPRENTPSPITPASNKPSVQSSPVPQQQESEDMPFKKQNTGAIKIFTIFAEEDRRHKERLEKQLSPYVRNGLMELCDRDQFIAGRLILDEINYHIASSRIILLLISSDFAASEWCYTEMEHAIRHRASHHAIVAPIYIRPTDWPDAPFKDWFSLPRNLKPVISWSNQDEAWNDIAKELRSVCEAERKKNG